MVDELKNTVEKVIKGIDFNKCLESLKIMTDSGFDAEDVKIYAENCVTNCITRLLNNRDVGLSEEIQEESEYENALFSCRASLYQDNLMANLKFTPWENFTTIDLKKLKKKDKK